MVTVQTTLVKERTALETFRKFLLVALVIAALLSACAPAQPTQSTDQIQAQIATSVAMTVAAQQQLIPAATATSTQTEIPAQVVLPTLTPVLPTATTFVVVPPSSGGSGGSGGSSGSSSSTKPQKYHCTLVGQIPQDNSPATTLKVGDTLDVNWTLKNDGTITWDPTWPWEFYSSAVDTNVPANSTLTMSSVGFQSTLGTSVAPGQTITLGVELTAPNFDGREPIHITTSWMIRGDGIKFCHPWINVEVIRPGMTP